MEIIGKVKIKDEVTTADIANVVNNIVDSIIFIEGGEVVYQPYCFQDAVKMSVFVCLVEGVRVGGDDRILDILKNDKIIRELVEDYITNGDEITEIMSNAYDMIDFKKQLYLQQNDELNKLLKTAVIKENALNDMLLELAKTQNRVLTQQIEANKIQEEVYSKLSTDELASIQKKLASGEWDMNDMVDTVVKKYMEKDNSRDGKYKEIIDEKNKTIVELKDHLKKGGAK